MNITEWASNRLPKPILSIVQPVHSFFYKIYKNAKSQGLKYADRVKLVGPDAIYEENYYAKRQRDPWRSDAHNVASTLNEYFDPDSVIDFGCAIGSHLEPFLEHDVEIKGIEGNSAAFEHAVVPSDTLEQHDLREPYQTARTYDLALCFEVAEHIPDRFADVLVDTLVSASDTIVMTAAPPGQGGTHHVNEQEPDYWYEKFDQRGFVHDEAAERSLKETITVNETSWITDNLMVFVKST